MVWVFKQQEEGRWVLEFAMTLNNKRKGSDEWGISLPDVETGCKHINSSWDALIAEMGLRFDLLQSGLRLKSGVKIENR